MSSQGWFVVIEEQSGYAQGIYWRLTHSIPASGPEHAAELARHAAVNHVPKHPMKPRRRAVFRSPDGSWLVNVEGATMNFHFRVSTAEFFGIYPGKP